MSSTARFVSIGSFPFCLTDAALPATTYGSDAWVGPFSLAEAMGLFWNTEFINVQYTPPASGTTTISNSTTVEPKDRVCSGVNINVSASGAAFSVTLSDPRLSSGQYYFSVSVYINDDLDDSDVQFTLIGVNTPASPTAPSAEFARYNCTILGKTMSVALWGDPNDMDGSEAPEPIPPTYNPTLSIYPSDFTYV